MKHDEGTSGVSASVKDESLKSPRNMVLDLSEVCTCKTPMKTIHIFLSLSVGNESFHFGGFHFCRVAYKNLQLIILPVISICVSKQFKVPTIGWIDE